jgi:hypothetical protein
MSTSGKFHANPLVRRRSLSSLRSDPLIAASEF